IAPTTSNNVPRQRKDLSLREVKNESPSVQREKAKLPAWCSCRVARAAGLRTRSGQAGRLPYNKTWMACKDIWQPSPRRDSPNQLKNAEQKQCFSDPEKNCGHTVAGPWATR